MRDDQKLPTGWERTTIGVITNVNPRPNLGDVSDTTLVSFVPMAAVGAGSGQIDPSEQRQLATVRRGYTSFREEDVIFAKITPCMENGKTAVARGLTSRIGFGSTEFHVLRPTAAVNSDYLYYYVSQERFRQAARAKMTGTAGQLRVGSSFMSDAAFPLAPLAEQRRIVAAIEEQFTRLDAGVAALKSARARLKQYRAAVLKAAVEGELTKEWREAHPDTEPASELLVSPMVDHQVKGKTAPMGPTTAALAPTTEEQSLIPSSWCLCDVGDIVEFVTSGSRGWAKYYSDRGALFIRIGNLDHDTITLDLANVQRVSPPAGAEGTRTRVQPGDILVSITAELGMVALVPSEMEEAYINQHVALVRPANKLIASYLAWFLASPPGSLELDRNRRGATKVGLGLDDIKAVRVSLPPLNEQDQIVAEIEGRLSVLNILELTVQSGLQRAERLRQSILTEAFAGRLVLQDPNDEPASVLLGWIRDRSTAGIGKPHEVTRQRASRGAVTRRVADGAGAENRISQPRLFGEGA